MNKVHTNTFQNCYGKETIDTNTYGQSSGHNGNHSKNFQQTGRDLLSPDEVRKLHNNKAILLIRGENPVIDLKYNIKKHPNIKYTVDGKAKAYEHGVSDRAKGTMVLLKPEEMKKLKRTKEIEEMKDLTYELLSEEDIENYYLMEEYENEKRKQKNE